MKDIVFLSEKIHDVIAANKQKCASIFPTIPTAEDLRILFACSKNYGFEIDASLIQPDNVTGRMHQGAVLIIHGPYTIVDDFQVTASKGNVVVHMQIQQDTLFKERIKWLSSHLIEKKLVSLFPGCDSEYLYEILIATGDLIFEEDIFHYSKGLPMYEVWFGENGEFEVKDLGMA
ncbi:hypothetical protein COY90_03245 [Candidatus Roizmanbacteria bacterium CG_4_10_14_0_8_um_filter_39_9]|uniref:Uncharacterized protein n=1 Tax=Candidatus Roizmanbacteria bacterium CG_4_10_14_0_8_um_filter_39_9 TaxID=1974829 RepID=A0A2M7QDK3_9BACT|nr:MAG: hypothetical protein COY90_03245 [Candidatus Roizmanbacteria bacterium CG_4_10_14_0_8_um_filter_39_9]